jgi:hypothetical protein
LSISRLFMERTKESLLDVVCLITQSSKRSSFEPPRLDWIRQNSARISSLFLFASNRSSIHESISSLEPLHLPMLESFFFLRDQSQSFDGFPKIINSERLKAVNCTRWHPFYFAHPVPIELPILNLASITNLELDVSFDSPSLCETFGKLTAIRELRLFLHTSSTRTESSVLKDVYWPSLIYLDIWSASILQFNKFMEYVNVPALRHLQILMQDHHYRPGPGHEESLRGLVGNNILESFSWKCRRLFQWTSLLRAHPTITSLLIGKDVGWWGSNEYLEYLTNDASLVPKLQYIQAFGVGLDERTVELLLNARPQLILEVIFGAEEPFFGWIRDKPAFAGSLTRLEKLERLVKDGRHIVQSGTSGGSYLIEDKYWSKIDDGQGLGIDSMLEGK